jgi:undecaprenyl-diphosphatase
MRSCGMVVVLVIGGCAAAACGADAPAGGAAEPPQQISAVQALILGIVEGLTEYLPVSSTGHLILANDALGLSRFTDPAHPLRSGVEKVPGVDAYDIVIQLGAILAVLGLYRKRVGQMAKGLAGRDPQGLALVAALAVAFLPAAVVGVLAHQWIKATLFNPLSVVAALAAGGVLMIVIEHYFWRRRKDVPRITDVAQVRLWQALVIGLAQCLAMWPGTSRSMITILAALVIGLDMLAAAEFSFLLALPTLGAATLYEGYKSWHELSQSAGVEAMAIGLVASALVAALAVKGFVRWLTGHGLLPFGIYRLALAAVVFAYFAM